MPTRYRQLAPLFISSLTLIIATGCAGGASSRQSPSAAVSDDTAAPAGEDDSNLPPLNYDFGERSDISEVIRRYKSQYRFPGAVAAVLEGDRIIAIGAAGRRKRGERKRVTPDDKFHLGSCTKSMTATLAATFVDDKRISWSTRIGEVLSDARLHPQYRSVTLEQLLSHTAGTPTKLPKTHKDVWKSMYRDTRKGWQIRNDFSRRILSEAPETPPGDKYAYSNAGFMIAGNMLETIASQPWQQLMKKRIFAPLGMDNCGFGAPDDGSIANAWGHNDKGDPILPTRPGADNPAAAGPAGTVHCTITDWGKFVSATLAGARGEGTLVSKKAFESLYEPRTKRKKPPYALGWIVGRKQDWAGGRTLFHNGSNTMFYSTVTIAPMKNRAVMVITNQGGEAAVTGAKAIAEELKERFIKDAPVTRPSS